jgi:threonine/homoserine/homoserine lactone efflux protein
MPVVAAIIGFTFGFVGSITIAGPISLLVFAFGMAGRWRHALAISIGSSVAEAAYAFLAFWGLRHLLDAYPLVVPYTNGAGALVLAVLGLVFLLKRKWHSDKATMADPDGSADPTAPPRGRKRSFLLGFVITALNPTLIATWSTAVTALLSSGLLRNSNAGDAPAFALGACVGIVSWFALLLALVHRSRSRFRPESITYIVRLVGVALLGLAGWFAWRFLTFML